MDYLLSREKTSSLRSNPLRARSILVDCLISTDNLHTSSEIYYVNFTSVKLYSVYLAWRQDISVCNTMDDVAFALLSI